MTPYQEPLWPQTQKLINKLAQLFGCTTEHLTQLINERIDQASYAPSLNDFVFPIYARLQDENPTLQNNLSQLRALKNKTLVDEIIRDILSGSEDIYSPYCIEIAKFSYKYPHYTLSQIHLLAQGLTPKKVDLITELNLDYNYESVNSRSHISKDMLQFMKTHSISEIRKAFNFSAYGLTRVQNEFLITRYYTTGDRDLIKMLINHKNEWADIQESEEERGLDNWYSIYINAPDQLIADYYTRQEEEII